MFLNILILVYQSFVIIFFIIFLIFKGIEIIHNINVIVFIKIYYKNFDNISFNQTSKSKLIEKS